MIDALNIFKELKGKMKTSMIFFTISDYGVDQFQLVRLIKHTLLTKCKHRSGNLSWFCVYDKALQSLFFPLNFLLRFLIVTPL